MPPSAWFNIRERDAFLHVVKPGDLLEFRRNGYRHWAVYAGRPCNFRQYLSSTRLDPGVEYVVHRANPHDSDVLNFLSRSTSVAKGLHGIGNIQAEPLDEVWMNSDVRVNNSGDAHFGAGDVEDIFDRAFANFEEFSGRSRGGGDYNIAFNNCEHFANHCRYGRAWSGQVREAVGWTAAFVGVGALAYGIMRWVLPDREAEEREEREGGRRMAA